MARACFVLFFVCFIAACDFSNGYITRGRNMESEFKNEAPVSEDVLENKLGVEPEAPVEVTPNKQCAKIGEFCMNHSDCCTNSCLGYLKKCVS